MSNNPAFLYGIIYIAVKSDLANISLYTQVASNKINSYNLKVNVILFWLLTFYVNLITVNSIEQ